MILRPLFQWRPYRSGGFLAHGVLKIVSLDPGAPIHMRAIISIQNPTIIAMLHILRTTLTALLLLLILV